MEFTVERIHFNAIRIAAAQYDVRDYLNGFHLHRAGDVWQMESTDGHRLLRVPLEHREGDVPDGYRPEQPFSLAAVERKWPKKAGDTLHLLLDAHEVRIIESGHARVDVCPVIDSKYPDTDTVISNGADYPIGVLGVNPLYLYDVPRELDPKAPIKVTGTDGKGGGPLRVTMKGHPAVTYIVMPCRVD